MHFDRERLPTIEVRGQVVRSTAGRLHELLQQHAPAVTLPACYDALLASWREAERQRAIDHREVAAGVPRDVDLLALDQALDALARMDPRQARVVELRYFGGLAVREVAEVLEVGEATVVRDWASARAWLFSRLTS